LCEISVRSDRHHISTVIYATFTMHMTPKIVRSRKCDDATSTGAVSNPENGNISDGTFLSLHVCVSVGLLARSQSANLLVEMPYHWVIYHISRKTKWSEIEM